MWFIYKQYWKHTNRQTSFFYFLFCFHTVNYCLQRAGSTPSLPAGLIYAVGQTIYFTPVLLPILRVSLVPSPSPLLAIEKALPGLCHIVKKELIGRIPTTMVIRNVQHFGDQRERERKNMKLMFMRQQDSTFLWSRVKTVMAVQGRCAAINFWPQWWRPAGLVHMFQCVFFFLPWRAF